MPAAAARCKRRVNRDFRRRFSRHYGKFLELFVDKAAKFGCNIAAPTPDS
jgi:hypothetical protein